MRSITRQERSQIAVALQARRAIPMPPPTTCATGSAACAAGCPTRSTSRSSPRSRPTRSRSSISPSRRTGIRRSRSPTSPTASSRTGCRRCTGVAEARIFGERRYAMRIWLDAARLAAYSMTPQDVENALRSAERRGAGRPHREQRHASSRSCPRPTCGCRSSSARSSSSEAAGYPGAAARRRRARSAGPGRRARQRALQPARARSPIGVVKQAVANPLDISKDVRAELPAITETLPEGMRVEVALRHLDLHPGVDQFGLPHDRRGGPARRPGRLLLPAQVSARR